MDPRSLALTAQVSAYYRDSRVQRALAAWSACMASHGLRYARTVDAELDPRWGERDQATTAGAAETGVAATDADCRQQSNLVGIYKAVEIAYQQRLLDANATTLYAAAETFDEWLSTANTILAKN